MKKNYFFFLILIISILISASANIVAADKTWVGTTSEWNLASNWNPASLPNSNDDIIIPALPSGRFMPTLSSGNFTIKKLTINTSAILNLNGGTVILTSDALVKGTVNINSGTLDLNLNDKKITIDGGTINQSGGIVATKDMEIENGGTYNQFSGEFQIEKDLKVKSGTPINSFNGTGGTVRFTGECSGEFYGYVQFHNVIVDADAKLKMDNDNDNIKVSGNFINNNPDLDNKKGTVTFNGTNQQTIYSASTPPGSKTTFGNLVISNPTGVRLLSDIGVDNSFSTGSGGYLITDVSLLYVDGSIYEGPLPVELTSFSATEIGSTIKLNWQTATEINNYGFDVERCALSPERKAWIKIGFVNGSGNSNSPKSYFFVDYNVSTGKPAYRTGRYSYRLKQIDNDGQFEYSKAIEVDMNGLKKFELSQNYPNPFNPSTTIKFNLPEAGMVKLTLFNILGQEIRTLVNEFQESGVHTINLNASDLNSGMYIYKIESGLFTQTRKMTLVK